MHKDNPSKTAYKVALNIVTLGAKPGMETVLPPGIVEATEKLLIASGAASATLVRWSRSRRMVSVYEAFDWMLPGQFEAFGYRKAFCERQVRDGIDAGATQVLVLGAGYDTMGWRLATQFDDVKFFEIDHPATARLKARGVEAMGLPDNLYLVPAILGEQKLVNVLETNESWDQTAKSVIVAEGLLMYLPCEAVQDLFAQCAAIASDGSRMAFTYIGAGEDGRLDAGPWTGLVLWTLKLTGEPWVWSIRPENLGLFLQGTGWTNTPELVGLSDKHGVEFLGIAKKLQMRSP